MGTRRTPEQDFQQEIVKLAKLFQWRVFYVPDWMFRLAMASLKRMRKADRPWPDKGFPDMIFCKPPRFFLAELKAKGGKTSPQQDEWISDLRACGLTVYIWYDYKDMDEVIRVLSQ